ncbi:MAG TPA: DUF4382 domain-containing protein [Candidatus Polarisedimenticolia bacterium]|nr:DUF4382 domain-containing protein [Candidatus Polarisedimenticolia bacterium]
MISSRWIRTFLILSLALTVAACSSNHGESNSRTGNVRVMLTSAPATTGVVSGATTDAVAAGGSSWGDDDGGMLSRLSQANVTFSSLLARNLNGDLVNLSTTLPQTVDLIPVINGHEVSLPAGTLPAGMYDQFVVVITHVQFVFTDGAKIDLTPPGGGWTKIIPVQTFEVVDGQTTVIELRFNPDHAFDDVDGDFHFFPNFDCDTHGEDD